MTDPASRDSWRSAIGTTPGLRIGPRTGVMRAGSGGCGRGS
jgi:hypothetical protein